MPALRPPGARQPSQTEIRGARASTSARPRHQRNVISVRLVSLPGDLPERGGRNGTTCRAARTRGEKKEDGEHAPSAQRYLHFGGMGPCDVGVPGKMSRRATISSICMSKSMSISVSVSGDSCAPCSLRLSSQEECEQRLRTW
ncbi:hypothetical protein AAFF_G00391330 [Aldrovandia affinis]|uniref:Uncharacterized protein n=1 Tax=Aldrovandia affinis TaxID=143900 RepID=A0AAD7SDY6_9TELE|nr:hypothetical protein AAFF_G00391330 [Aldrovandia affinis]